MKIYETYADGSIDIEARDVRPGDVLRMIIFKDILVEEVKVDEERQEVTIGGRYLDEFGDVDVTTEQARDVVWPELLYTVFRQR